MSSEKEYTVSVICITYNQKQYLRKAIDSILSQKTSFDYELIICDDASNDGTTDIVIDYANNYPDKIKAIIHSKNLYSQGIDFPLSIIKSNARGEYIALCEGDDYWTDDNKLQIQFEALEQNTDCDMCACWGATITEDGLREVSQIRPLRQNGILPVEAVILGGGQYLVTAGLFFRKEMCTDMKGLDSLDYSFQIRGAFRGGIYYIDRKMAVYRRYAKGSWTNRVLHNEDNLSIQWMKEKQLLESFDQNTSGSFHEVIEKRMMAYTPFKDQLEKNKDEIEKVINCCDRPCYLWGLGRRGKSLELFLRQNGVCIDGVCDAVNEDIGDKDECGNEIFSTSYVLKNASTILVSNRLAFNDLEKMNLEIKIIDFQEFMPLG